MKATEVTAGLAESNGSLLPGLWRDSLHVTCGLTACTPRSAPGPALGNEYGKTFFLLLLLLLLLYQHRVSVAGVSADVDEGGLMEHRETGAAVMAGGRRAVLRASRYQHVRVLGDGRHARGDDVDARRHRSAARAARVEGP